MISEDGGARAHILLHGAAIDLHLMAHVKDVVAENEAHVVAGSEVGAAGAKASAMPLGSGCTL